MRVNKLFGTLVVTCILVGSVRGEPIIDVGFHNLQPNSAGQKVKLYVTGDPNEDYQFTGFNLRAQIGDGTEPTPVFQSNAIDIDSSIWEVDGKSVSFVGGPVVDREEVVQQSVAFNEEGYEITLPDDDEALLLTLTIDTTGISNGEFGLRLKDTDIGVPSVFILSGEGGNTGELEPIITNGTVNVVPEPASVMLLSVGGLFAGMVGFFARRRRKQ